MHAHSSPRWAASSPRSVPHCCALLCPAVAPRRGLDDATGSRLSAVVVWRRRSCQQLTGEVPRPSAARRVAGRENRTPSAYRHAQRGCGKRRTGSRSVSPRRKPELLPQRRLDVLLESPAVAAVLNAGAAPDEELLAFWRPGRDAQRAREACGARSPRAQQPGKPAVPRRRRPRGGRRVVEPRDGGGGGGQLEVNADGGEGTSGVGIPQLDWRVNHWLSMHGHKTEVLAMTKSVQMLKEWFKFLDAKGTGRVGVAELEEPLVSVGLAASRDDVISLVAAANRDGSGALSFKQFLGLMSASRMSDVPVVHVSAVGGGGGQRSDPPLSEDPLAQSQKLRAVQTKAFELRRSSLASLLQDSADEDPLVPQLGAFDWDNTMRTTTSVSSTALSTVGGGGGGGSGGGPRRTSGVSPRRPSAAPTGIRSSFRRLSIHNGGPQPPRRCVSVLDPAAAGSCRVWVGRKRPAAHRVTHSDTSAPSSEPPTRANSPVADDPDAPTLAVHPAATPLATTAVPAPPPRGASTRVTPVPMRRKFHRRRSSARSGAPAPPRPPTAVRQYVRRRRWSCEVRAGKELVRDAQMKQQEARMASLFGLAPKPAVVQGPVSGGAGAPLQMRRVDLRAVRKLFMLFREGKLGSAELSFPVLISAHRRHMLMDANMEPEGSLKREAGLRVLEAVKRTARMGLWSLAHPDQAAEVVAGHDARAPSHVPSRSTAAATPMPRANAWSGRLSVASVSELQPFNPADYDHAMQPSGSEHSDEDLAHPRRPSRAPSLNGDRRAADSGDEGQFTGFGGSDDDDDGDFFGDTVGDLPVFSGVPTARRASGGAGGSRRMRSASCHIGVPQQQRRVSQASARSANLANTLNTFKGNKAGLGLYGGGHGRGGVLAMSAIPEEATVASMDTSHSEFMGSIRP